MHDEGVGFEGKREREREMGRVATTIISANEGLLRTTSSSLWKREVT